MSAKGLKRELASDYKLHRGFPPVDTYRHLRAASGLRPVTEAQAMPVASNSWYGCYMTYSSSGIIVGMGRIISDGGWYFHVADMAVLPNHQRRGVGDALLTHLLCYIRDQAPEGDPYVSLLADLPGRKLYEMHGFVDGMPKEMGMVMPNKWRKAYTREAVSAART